MLFCYVLVRVAEDDDPVTRIATFIEPELAAAPNFEAVLDCWMADF